MAPEYRAWGSALCLDQNARIRVSGHRINSAEVSDLAWGRIEKLLVHQEAWSRRKLWREL